MNKRTSYMQSSFKTRAEPGEAEGGKKYIEGYFVVFNQRTELWPGFFEEIDPAAFNGSLNDNDVRCLYNHTDNIVLGRTGNKTVTLTPDAHGLWGEIEINQNDAEAMNAYARIDRGDVCGCSFGFIPTAEERIELPDGSVLYRVKEADLREVSPCTFPAYPQTEIQARRADYEAARKRSAEGRISEIKNRLEKLKC